MSTTPLKLEETIRFRAESELKEKLEQIAPKKRKRFAQFMREELWNVVAREEAAGMIFGTPAEPAATTRTIKKSSKAKRRPPFSAAA